MKKTFLSCVAFFALCCSSTIAFAETSSTMPVYANSSGETDLHVTEILEEYMSEYPDRSREIFDSVDMLINTENYKSLHKHNAAAAYELIKDNLDYWLKRSDIVPYGSDNRGLFYSDYTVPTIKQSTPYNCGIASTLEALIGNGALKNVASNKSAKKMTELADIVEYDEGNPSRRGIQAWMAETIFNEYGFESYECINLTSYTCEYIISDMCYSLMNGYCPIVCFTDTSELNYYTIPYEHWVAVSKINDVTKEITLVDPFNSSLVSGSSSSFGGVHTVSADEFIDAVGIDVDGWIVMYG